MEDTMNKKKLISLILILGILLGLAACSFLPDSPGPDNGGSAETTLAENVQQTGGTADASPVLDPEGIYTTKEDVALYIHLYGRLPENFITKSEARALGWSGGSVERYARGKCIGGDRFNNFEGLLPDAAGRVWYECDIETLGESSRGSKRIVFSNDGLIYYTADHYKTFELLYGEE